MGFIKWIGRMILWVLLLPIGIWRSLRHHRRKGVRQVEKEMGKAMRNARQSVEKQNPPQQPGSSNSV